MRQEVHLRGGAGARRPAEIAALPDIYLFGGGGREGRGRGDPAKLEKKTRPLGWDLQGSSVKARPQPASQPPHSIRDSWGQPCSLWVLVGVSGSFPVCVLCALLE